MNRFHLLLLGVALSGSAYAVDGVFEINESCVAFGCFDGDGPGLPVQIVNSGSYRLTGNLTTNDLNTDVIDINANTVTIDLNGFSVQGPVSCSGSNVSCSANGIGDGIDASGFENITISNGAVIGMGDDGIRVGRGAYLEELIVAENAGVGIEALTAGSVLRRLSVRENGGNGISMGFASSYLMDSTVFNNGSQGVFGGFCGNVLMSANDSGDSCVAIAPNRCDTASDCD
jgi:hypothetical protein